MVWRREFFERTDQEETGYPVTTKVSDKNKNTAKGESLEGLRRFV